MSLTPDSFPEALRQLLRAQSRSSSSSKGWAPSHTASIDAYLAPGLALEQLALGSPPPTPPVIPDLTITRGRPLYRALFAYSLARSGGSDPALHRLCEGLLAHPGTQFVVCAFASLTLAVLTRQPSPLLANVIQSQRASGEFLDASPYDSPDLHWYDELVLLHALASHQALFPTETGLVAIRRSALFHTAETQPDHATSQPWALHAFGLAQETLPLADLLLHGALAQNVGRLDVVSRLLVADALLALSANASPTQI